MLSVFSEEDDDDDGLFDEKNLKRVGGYRFFSLLRLGKQWPRQPSRLIPVADRSCVQRCSFSWPVMSHLTLSQWCLENNVPLLLEIQLPELELFVLELYLGCC